MWPKGQSKGNRPKPPQSAINGCRLIAAAVGFSTSAAATIRRVSDKAKDEGDPELAKLYEEFGGHLISPGGAAGLLGLSRKTIHTLGERGTIRVFRSNDEERGKLGVSYGPKWVLIPLVDLKAYADRVGREFPDIDLEA